MFCSFNSFIHSITFALLLLFCFLFHIFLKLTISEPLLPFCAYVCLSLCVCLCVFVRDSYLWKHFNAETVTFEHIMSIVIIINEKFREGVPAWGNVNVLVKLLFSCSFVCVCMRRIVYVCVG